MKGEFVLNIIESLDYRVWHHELAGAEFISVNLYTNSSLGVESDVIYVTDSAELFAEQTNILRTENKTQALDLYDRVRNLFKDEFKLEKGYKHLVAKVAQTSDLNDLMDAIADMYQRPVNMVSNSYAILAYARNIPFYHPGLYREIENGFVSPEDIRYLNLKTIRSGKRMDETVIVANEREQVFHYMTPILSERVVLGFYSVFVRPGEKLSMLEKSYLPMIAMQIGMVLRRKDFYSLNKDNYYTNLFAAILSGELSEKEEIENRIKAFDFRLLPCCYIVSVEVVDQIRSEVVIQELIDRIKIMLNNAFYMVQKENSYFFASYNDDENADESLQELERTIASFPGVKVSCSDHFTDVTEIPVHVSEAEMALQAGVAFNPHENFYRISEYRLKYCVLQLCNCTDGKSLLQIPLKKVLHYDHRHGTNLLFTLYTDNRLDGDVAETCEKLHIHRNTLYARRQKINEIAGMNLYDPEQKPLILMSIMMMHLSKLIDWVE